MIHTRTDAGAYPLWIEKGIEALYILLHRARTVVATGHHERGVLVEVHGSHGIRVCRESVDAVPGLHLPQLHRLVKRAARLQHEASNAKLKSNESAMPSSSTCYGWGSVLSNLLVQRLDDCLAYNHARSAVSLLRSLRYTSRKVGTRLNAGFTILWFVESLS